MTMYSPARQPLSPKAFEPELQRLNRAIRFSQGQFSIVLLQAASPLTRQRVLKSLRQTKDIKELALHPTVTDLFATIQQYARQADSLQILSVVGLNNLENLEEVLSRMNFSRDQFQLQFHFPMLWWIDANVSRQLRRVAPDFSNCLTTPIQFTSSDTESFHLADRLSTKLCR